MALNWRLRQEIIDILVNLPAFQSGNARKALLLNAGLDDTLKAIDLSGSTIDFVSRLVEHLDQYGILPDQQPALVHLLLHGVATQVGLERQKTLQALCERLIVQTNQATQYSETCPYRGLSAFQEEDQAYFFGREACISNMLNMLKTNQFAAVLGASGSGKSSTVYAGLIPKLRSQNKWIVISFRPGEKPFKSASTAMISFLDSDLQEVDRMVEIKKLTDALQSRELGLGDVIERIQVKHPHSQLLLFVDQFEEVYALCDNAKERHLFLDSLLDAFEFSKISKVSLVLTLRSDFLGHTQSHLELNQLIAKYAIIIPAMNIDELRRAIIEPANVAEQPLSAEVVELLLEQSVGREGVLPLLEFALTRLWEGMIRGVEPADTLKQIGGVGGALAIKTQDLFDNLNEPEKQLARRAFLAMIRLGEGTRDTRRRINIAEIIGHKDDPEQVHRVLRHFAHPGARLITLTDNTAEITHEALFDYWDMLKSWLDESRDDLRFHRRLTNASQHWDACRRSSGLLWRPPDLDLLEQYHQHNEQDMTTLEVTFFQRSKYAQFQLKRRKRITSFLLASLTLVSVIGVIVAIRFGLIAKEERDSAKIARNEAIRQEKIAETHSVQALSLASNALFESHDQIGALITGINALRKLEHINLPEKTNDMFLSDFREILKGTFEKNRLEGHAAPIGTICLSPDDELLASGSFDGKIKLWKVNDGREITTLKGHVGAILHLQFSSDSQTLISASVDGIVKFWHVETGREVRSIPLIEGVLYPFSITPNAELFALVNDENRILIRHIENDKNIWKLLTNEPSSPSGAISCLAFNHNQTMLASGTEDGEVKLWNIRLFPFREESYSIPIKWEDESGVVLQKESTSGVHSMDFNYDDTILAVGSSDGTVTLWNLQKKEDIVTLQAHAAPVYSVRFSSDSKILVSGGADDTLKIWNLENNKVLYTFRGHSDVVYSVTISSNGMFIASGSRDHTIRLLDFEKINSRVGIFYENSRKHKYQSLHSLKVRKMRLQTFCQFFETRFSAIRGFSDIPSACSLYFRQMSNMSVVLVSPPIHGAF